MHHRDHALAIAAAVAGAEPDALAVALVGSVATGTDHPHSDIDLIAAAATGPGTRVLHVEGRMVTLTRAAPDDLAAALTRPRDAGAAVPAWRTARLLHDPDGVLRDLKARADAWTWDRVEDPDRWAAGELVGLAEEVHKVHGMLAQGRARAAAANRLILTLALAVPMAAANRLLYGSENDLWDALAAAEGPGWAADWDTAAGLAPAGPEAAARTACALYRRAASRLAPHLAGTDRTVVTAAADL
ncbi:hypothetical protein GCM10009830_43210 [Glycomyces endophyticus]|uniref:Polymerase nucleotidyl transferase domain-containing protein n=1 Tax=Glycomyces endophyticus TaxID=480996 RepID=A0ABP4TMR5_9ACTN